MSAEGPPAPVARLLPPLGPLGGRGWLVGGGLRDALMGRPVGDVDVALDGDADAASRALAREHRAGRFRLSAAFGAWRVQGGRLPFTVDVTPLQGGSLAEDLGRRDFTVNALAVPLAGGGAVVDLHDGLADIRAGRLRLVRPTAFRSDPVRLLRLVRVAGQLGFSIAPDAAERARADAALVTGSAPERLMDELARILAQDAPWRGVDLLDDLRVLTALVPELERGRGMEQNPYHHRDVLGHILEVVRHSAEIAADPGPVFGSSSARVAARLAEPLADEMTRGQALLLGALFHDVAKPATRAVTPDGRITFMGHDVLGAEMAVRWLTDMRVATRLRDAVAVMVRRHLPLGFLVHRAPLSLIQIDRYLRLTEPAEVEVMVLSVADRFATRGPRTSESAVRRHVALAREVMRVHLEIEDRGPVRAPLDGAEVAAVLGREPGPWLREVLPLLREQVLVGRVRNRGEAVRFCRNWADRVLK
jgi:poly(A) polymerase